MSKRCAYSNCRKKLIRPRHTSEAKWVKRRFCSKECQKAHWGSRKGHIPRGGVEAYCPKCERIHHISVNWQGSGKLRMFCKSCRDCDLNSPDVETYAIGFSITRRGKW